MTDRCWRLHTTPGIVFYEELKIKDLRFPFFKVRLSQRK